MTIVVNPPREARIELIRINPALLLEMIARLDGAVLPLSDGRLEQLALSRAVPGDARLRQAFIDEQGNVALTVESDEFRPTQEGYAIPNFRVELTARQIDLVHSCPPTSERTP